MGSSPEYNPTPLTVSLNQVDPRKFDPTNLYGGEQLWKLLSEKMNEGLPQDIKDTIIKQALGGLSGTTELAKRNIEQAVQGSGLSQSAKLTSIGDIYKNNAQVLSNLYSNLGMQDYQTKQANFATGLAGLQNLLRLGLQKGSTMYQTGMGLNQLENQLLLGKYQIDKSNEFDWGNLAGNILQTGGQLGGLAILTK